MTTQEQTATPPWDGDYRMPLSSPLIDWCFSVALSATASIASSLFVGLFLLGAMFAVKESTLPPFKLFLLLTGIGLVFLFVWVGLFRIWDLNSRCHRNAKRQGDRILGHIRFVENHVLWSLEGPASAKFTDKGVVLAGERHRHGFAPLLVFPSLILVTRLIRISGQGPFVSLALGLAVAILVFRIVRRVENARRAEYERISLEVNPEDIESVHCNGPLVTIRFAAPLACNLRRVRFFVAPYFREHFFTKFDDTFPQALPEEYRAACGIARARALR